MEPRDIVEHTRPTSGDITRPAVETIPRDFVEHARPNSDPAFCCTFWLALKVCEHVMFGLELLCLLAAATIVQPNNFDETRTDRRPILMGGKQYPSSRCRPPSYARVVRGGQVQARAHARASSQSLHSHFTLRDPLGRAFIAGRTLQEGHHPGDLAVTAGGMVENFSLQHRSSQPGCGSAYPSAIHKTVGHKSGDQKVALRSRDATCKIEHFENVTSFASDDNTLGCSGRFCIADGQIYDSRPSGVENVRGERGSKTSATPAATYAADRHTSYSVSSPLAVSPIRLLGNPFDRTETMRPPSPILAQGPVSACWRQNE